MANNSELHQISTKRFSNSLSEEELKTMIDSTKSENSIKKAKWAVKVFKEWLSERQKNGLVNGLHVFKDLESMSQSELNSQLPFFFFEVRKMNGEYYPSNSLRDIFQGIGYYLNQILGKPYKLFSDKEFGDSRNALDASMKCANKAGIKPSGNGSASPISHEQEELMWSRNVLGHETPKQLINTIFFLAGKYFALRGGKEHRELEWQNQIRLEQTQSGECLVYSNTFAKNYSGGLKQQGIKPKEVKVFENIENPDRCFIRLFKQYTKLRPTGKCTAFYLKPKTEITCNKWFDDVAIGHNTLANMMKSMADVAGLQGGNFVNHSLKKTSATNLRHCSEVQRRAVTGNRSNAQNVYEVITDEDFKTTSNILHQTSTNVCSATSELYSRDGYRPKGIVHVREQCEYIEINPPETKKMKIEVDGNSNKLIFTFE